MIKLLQMAELVHDEVVLGLGWQSYDFPIEVEVAIARTAAPPGALIFDKYFVVREVVKLIEMRKSRMNKCASRFAICHIHLFAMVAPPYPRSAKYNLEKSLHEYTS